MNIAIDETTIADFCQQYHIRKLSLFGSVLRDDFSPSSDVDVLVEFEPGAVIGYKFIEIQDKLSALLGREVDLNTPDFLSRHFRQRVIDTAQVIYER
jgi:predicted nucleotidyltransferase